MTPTGAKWVTHNIAIWAYKFSTHIFFVRLLHKRERQATYIPDKQCPVPMDKLEDYRRTKAQGRDGTTEGQLHSWMPTQARRTLDGQPWTGETWFKVKPGFEPSRPTIARPTSTRTDPQPSKEIQLSAAPATIHTYQKPIGQTPTTLTQSAVTTTGIPHPKHPPTTTGDYWIKEGHLWKEFISMWEQISTYHNKHMMDQMSHNYVQHGWHLSNQQMATGHTDLVLPGQQRHRQRWTYHGQVQQTLKNKYHTKMNISQLKREWRTTGGPSKRTQKPGSTNTTRMRRTQLDFNYHIQCIQSCQRECGRVQAVLSNSVVQSDQEEHLVSLLKATATKLLLIMWLPRPMCPHQ